MSPIWPEDLVTRMSRRALALVGWLVPGGVRSDWMNEWEAELWQLRQDRGGRVHLIVFLAGASLHGLWEWKEGWRMETLLQDARYAFRTLARSPGFTIAAVVMLALPIGANTALFSVLEEAILADPPYPDPDRLVVVDMLFGSTPSSMGPSEWSYPRYRALQEEVTLVGGMAGYGSRTMTLTDLGDPVIVPVEVATPSLFPLLGIDAVRGRVFGPDEVDNGSPVMAALVSHAFWLTRMGGDPDVVGSVVTLDQLRFQVLGVVQPGFTGITGGAELWITFSSLREVVNPDIIEDAWNQHFNVMGRLADGATLENARAEAAAFGSTIMERFPPPVAASRLIASADVVSFTAARVNPGARASMFALFGAVVLVLLIATANLAGLLLTRGATRHREAAIRASLGAGRGRLLRQLLTESLALSMVGGVLGVGLAWLGIDLMGVWLADALGTGGGRGLQYLNTDGLSINWRVLSFAFVLTGGVGIGFGMFPAWQAARTDPNTALKGSDAPSGLQRKIKGLTGRSGLIVVQVAVAMILLSGASLMMRSLSGLQSMDTGFESENLLTAMYSLSPTDEQAGIDPGDFHVAFIERVRQIPGVTGATVGEIPQGGPRWNTIVMGSEGRPDLSPAMHTWLRMQPVSEGYLEVLGAKLIEGRDIETTDDWNTDKVILLSRPTAEELFPDGSPIGRRIELGWSGYGGAGAQVIGVYEDLQLGTLGEPRGRQALVAVRQAPKLETGVMIRSEIDPMEIAPAVRSALAEMAPHIALTSVMPMDVRAAASTSRSRVITLLLGVFSTVSLLLVAAGLYGTIAFTVTRRTRELGLRASLGAPQASLAGLVIRQGLGVTLVGIIVGVIGSFWATRFLQGLLFGTESLDPVTLTVASTVLFVVALAAAYLPARHAMRIDPMVALRAD